jgi:hypothetical protein
LHPGIPNASLKKFVAKQIASVSNISADNNGYLYFLSCESICFGYITKYSTACLIRSGVCERY